VCSASGGSGFGFGRLRPLCPHERSESDDQPRPEQSGESERLTDCYRGDNRLAPEDVREPQVEPGTGFRQATEKGSGVCRNVHRNSACTQPLKLA